MSEGVRPRNELGTTDEPVEIEQQSGAARQPGEAIPVSGHVVDALGKPCSGVRVLLLGAPLNASGLESLDPEKLEPLSEQETLEDGSFRFAGIDRLRMVLLAEKSGFAEARCWASTQIENRLLLHQVETLQLSGDVSDRNGQPVAAFHVTAWLVRGGSTQSAAERDIQSPSGEFQVELPTLPPDCSGIRVVVRARDFSTSDPLVVSVADVRRHKRIAVLLDKAALALRGFVFRPDGQPVENAAIVVFASRDANHSSARSDREGAFSIPLKGPEMPSWLFVEGQGFAPCWVDLTKEAPTAGGEWIIQLKQGALVRGTLKNASGAPLAGWRVRTWRNDADPSAIGRLGAWSRSVVCNERGEFAMENVPEGAIAVGLDQPQSQRPGQRAQCAGYALHEIQLPETILALVLPHGSTLTGTILVERIQAALLQLEVLDADHTEDHIAFGEAATGQSFTLTSIRDGKLVLRVWLNSTAVTDIPFEVHGTDVDLGTVHMSPEKFGMPRAPR